MNDLPFSALLIVVLSLGGAFTLLASARRVSSAGECIEFLEFYCRLGEWAVCEPKGSFLCRHLEAATQCDEFQCANTPHALPALAFVLLAVHAARIFLDVMNRG